MAKRPVWADKPADKDYVAAANYLSLLVDTDTADKVVDALKTANGHTFFAKDIFRASGYPLLPKSNKHVRDDLKKIKRGVAMAPVLLVRGGAKQSLVIADGYHRCCAVYHASEDDHIDARITTWTGL